MYSPPPLPPGGLFLRPVGREAPDCYLFVDACIKYPRVSGGALLLDNLGVVIWAHGKIFNLISRDSTLAELHALLFGLALIPQRNSCSVWVGTDSFQALEHLNKRSERYVEVIRGIELLARQFNQVHFQNIHRRHNKDADALAAKA